MPSFRRTVYYLAIGLVLLSCLLGEVEGRRKILRGRKVITRTYYPFQTLIDHIVYTTNSTVAQWQDLISSNWGTMSHVFHELYKLSVIGDQLISGGTAIPAWSIVVIVAFCMMIIGGIMYGIMRKIVLGSSNEDYTVTNTNDEV